MLMFILLFVLFMFLFSYSDSDFEENIIPSFLLVIFIWAICFVAIPANITKDKIPDTKYKEQTNVIYPYKQNVILIDGENYLFWKDKNKIRGIEINIKSDISYASNDNFIEIKREYENENPSKWLIIWGDLKTYKTVRYVFPNNIRYEVVENLK